MRNAKVGAVPQPATDEVDLLFQHDDVRCRGGTEHGITMQDLKKQTAMRLAQEHNQQRAGSMQQQTHLLSTSGNTFGINGHSHPRIISNQHVVQNQTNLSVLSHKKKLSQHSHILQYDVQSGANILKNSDKKLMRGSSHTHHQPQQQDPLNSRSEQLTRDKNKCRNDYHDSSISTPRKQQGLPLQPKQIENCHPAFDGQSCINSQVNWESENVNNDSSVQQSCENERKTHEEEIPRTQKSSNKKSSGTVASLQAATVGKLSYVFSQKREASNSPSTTESYSILSNFSRSKGNSSSARESTSGVSSSHCSSSARSSGHKNNVAPKAKNIHSTKEHSKDLKFNAPEEVRKTLQHDYRNKSSNKKNNTSNNQMNHNHNRSIKHNNTYYHHNHQVKNHNKLPHGLTVNELKEMTRARLAAEAAAEKINQHTASESNCHELMNTLDTSCINPQHTSSLMLQNNSIVQHSKMQNSNVHKIGQEDKQSLRVGREAWRKTSHNNDSYANQSKNDMYSQEHGSFHTNFHPNYVSPNRNTHNQYISSQSLHPYGPHGDLHGSVRPHLDSHDSTSVTSTITSEYLGSETASVSYLGSSSTQQTNVECNNYNHLYNEPTQFVRSWSYPSGPNVSINDGTERHIPLETSSQFDGLRHGAIGSRRRLESSPAGYHLEVTHEYAPITSIHSKRVENREEKVSPIGGHSFFGKKDERFVGESRPSHLSRNERGVSINGELPNWVAESVLGTPLMPHDNERVDGYFNKGVDSVFRSNNQDPIIVPLNDDLDLRSMSSRSYLYPEGPSIGKGACYGGSWGDASTSVKSSGTNIAEIISQDIGNLLSLDPSSSNHLDAPNSQKYDHFVSRIDPEVALADDGEKSCENNSSMNETLPAPNTTSSSSFFSDKYWIIGGRWRDKQRKKKEKDSDGTS